jgi:hypothetical protein
MIQTRKFTEADVLALQNAVDRDTHNPAWKVKDFYNPSPDPEEGYVAPVQCSIISDDERPIAFVRYTKTLRISCIWNDESDTRQNARAIIFGINDAVQKARTSGFSEIIITTSNPQLANFFTKMLKMTKSGDEYVLAV